MIKTDAMGETVIANNDSATPMDITVKKEQIDSEKENASKSRVQGKETSIDDKQRDSENSSISGSDDGSTSDGESGSSETSESSADSINIILKAPSEAPLQRKTSIGNLAQPNTAAPLDVNSIPTIEGQSLLDFDLNAIDDKPWRKPGADITDYFNYGFNEQTWKLYCAKQKLLRDEFSSQKRMGVFDSDNNARGMMGMRGPHGGPPPPVDMPMDFYGDDSGMYPPDFPVPPMGMFPPVRPGPGPGPGPPPFYEMGPPNQFDPNMPPPMQYPMRGGGAPNAPMGRNRGGPQNINGGPPGPGTGPPMGGMPMHPTPARPPNAPPDMRHRGQGPKGGRGGGGYNQGPPSHMGPPSQTDDHSQPGSRRLSVPHGHRGGPGMSYDGPPEESGELPPTRNYSSDKPKDEPAVKARIQHSVNEKSRPERKKVEVDDVQVKTETDSREKEASGRRGSRSGGDKDLDREGRRDYDRRRKKRHRDGESSRSHKRRS